jgi:hypothetical protein
MTRLGTCALLAEVHFAVRRCAILFFTRLPFILVKGCALGCDSMLVLLAQLITTFNNGCLGYHDDEERGEMR